MSRIMSCLPHLCHQDRSHFSITKIRLASSKGSVPLIKLLWCFLGLDSIVIQIDFKLQFKMFWNCVRVMIFLTQDDSFLVSNLIARC